MRVHSFKEGKKELEKKTITNIIICSKVQKIENLSKIVQYDAKWKRESRGHYNQKENDKYKEVK